MDFNLQELINSVLQEPLYGILTTLLGIYEFSSQQLPIYFHQFQSLTPTIFDKLQHFYQAFQIQSNINKLTVRHSSFVDEVLEAFSELSNESLNELNKIGDALFKQAKNHLFYSHSHDLVAIFMNSGLNPFDEKPNLLSDSINNILKSLDKFSENVTQAIIPHLVEFEDLMINHLLIICQSIYFGVEGMNRVISKLIKSELYNRTHEILKTFTPTYFNKPKETSISSKSKDEVIKVFGDLANEIFYNMEEIADSLFLFVSERVISNHYIDFWIIVGSSDKDKVSNSIKNIVNSLDFIGPTVVPLILPYLADVEEETVCHLWNGLSFQSVLNKLSDISMSIE